MLDLVALFSLTFPFNICLLLAVLNAMNTERERTVIAPVKEEEQELTPRPFKHLDLPVPPPSNSSVEPESSHQQKSTPAMEFSDVNQRRKIIEFQAVILAGHGNA